jgi:uncharacterized protein YjiS (DUF1127 family)
MFASLHTARLTCRQVQKGGTLDRLAETLVLALSTRRQRRQLAQLDARALHDLGLTADQATTEAARPFWDVPAAWRR